VLLLAPSTRILGGQSLQAARLHRKFQGEPGVDASLIAYDPDLPKALRWIEDVPYVRTVVRTSMYLLQLVRALPRFDVVHAFSASFWSFLINPAPAVVAARLMGRPCIVNYRSGEAPIHLAKRRWMAKPLLRLASVIVVPSAYLGEIFSRYQLTTHTIPNTVDLERFTFRERGPVEPRLLSNRALEPLYNVECVIRAFALVQARRPDASLVIAGDGSERARLERVVSDLALNHVQFAGALPAANMAEAYDSADILVSTPVLDNMPNSLVEAFAAGIPIVASNVGGVPYIVRQGETGLLVPSNDPTATAGAVLRLLEEPALARRLSVDGRRECEARYTWPAARNAWLGLYAQLALRPTEAGG